MATAFTYFLLLFLFIFVGFMRVSKSLSQLFICFLFVLFFFWRISSNSLTGLPNTQAFLWIAPVATRVEFQARY